MGVAATSSFTFPFFSNLSPELHAQIWQSALPCQVEPALYFYRKGYEYDPEREDFNLIFEFRHDLLDTVQFEIPLFFVNHEARCIALAWVREHSIEIRASEKRQSPVFGRSFQLICDTLYIALDKWDEFVCESDNPCFEPDLLEQILSVSPANVTSIAVPDALLQNKDILALLEMMDRYSIQAKVLFIIINTPSDLQPVNNKMKVQQRWELESGQEEAFVWNYSRGGFDFNDSGDNGDEALYRLLGKDNKELGKELIKNHILSHLAFRFGLSLPFEDKLSLLGLLRI